MSHLRLSILGLLFILAAFARADESGDDNPPKGMVKVEQPDVIYPKPPAKEFTFRSYGERRKEWGGLVGFEYNTYDPIFFGSAFVAEEFKDVYPKKPMLEAQLVMKRNLSIGSVGGEFGLGYYTNSSVVADSKLTIWQMRVGLIFIADRLFKEPYVAPYASLGTYVLSFKESSEGEDDKGNTRLAMYATIGVQFQLDGLEPSAARTAYRESSLESTFLFVEGRKYFKSSSNLDPDTETNVIPEVGGLRLEF